MNFDKWFADPTPEPVPPEARRWEALQRKSGARRLVCEFHREREGLSFGPARFAIDFVDADTEVPPEIAAWDKRLDDWLIQHGAKAKTLENEAVRFGFGLRERLEPIEQRYGSGFFNAVLNSYLRTSDFASQPSVAAKLSKVHESSPAQGESAWDCSARIEHVLASCLLDDLMKALGYGRDSAVTILSNAVAYYLDERFNITSRALLGWA